MAALLPVLLQAENALATSLPNQNTAEALQAHWEAWQAIKEAIRQISTTN